MESAQQVEERFEHEFEGVDFTMPLAGSWEHCLRLNSRQLVVSTSPKCSCGRPRVRSVLVGSNRKRQNRPGGG
jgi:hypothetical protein